MEYTTLQLWCKHRHSYYAPSDKLYDPYYVKSIRFDVPSEWLEGIAEDYGYDSVADMMEEYTPEMSEKIYLDATYAKAKKDSYLWALCNADAEDVESSSMRDLLHDAYVIRDAFDNLGTVIDFMGTKKKPDNLGEQVSGEWDACEAILDAAEREIYDRLCYGALDGHEYREGSSVYIDFLSNYDSDKVRSQSIIRLYADAFKLCDFFDNVKEAKNKRHRHEYEHCEKMLDNILVTLRDRKRCIYG